MKKLRLSKGSYLLKVSTLLLQSWDVNPSLVDWILFNPSWREMFKCSRLGQGSGFSGEGWESLLEATQGLWAQEIGPHRESPGPQSSEPQYPLWGCFPTSPPNSCLALEGTDRRGTFLSAGTLPRALQWSGAALAAL